MFAYTYQITVVDVERRYMEILFSSPGRSDVSVGARLPLVGETLDQVVAAYAPVVFWGQEDAPVVAPEVGATGGFTPDAVTPDTLGTAKQRKLAELAAARYEFEVGGMTIDGVQYSTDRQTQATITGALVGMSTGMLNSIEWKADNQWVTLTASAVQTLAQAIADHVQSSFALEKTLSEQVNAAETVEAVQAVRWPQ